MDFSLTFPNLPQHWSLSSEELSVPPLNSQVSNDCAYPQRKRPLKSVKTRFMVTLPLVLAAVSPVSWAFHHKASTSLFHRHSDPRHTRYNKLQLVPLSRFQTDLTFFSDESARICLDEKGKYKSDKGQEEEFELALVEAEDLPDLARFVVNAFGADAIRLSQDMNAFERMLLSPAAELLNSYSTVVAFAEVFSGTKQRLQSRFQRMNLSPPSVKGLSDREAIEVAERDSLVLALARPSEDDESRIQIIASIELRLQVSQLVAL
jgi:hypothetical protein